MKQSIEQQTAQTILQQPEEIKIGDKTYVIAPPSAATLILVSEAVSRLPKLHLDKKHVLEETLCVAKDFKSIGEIAAILILGAKHINDIEETSHTAVKRHLWGLFRTSHTVITKESKKERLSRELMEEITPRDFNNLIVRILNTMQTGDFFGLTTFLTEINLIRPTKVEIAATASGQ